MWWLEGAVRLSSGARTAISDEQTSVVVSAASVWELAIKVASGKMRSPGDLVGQIARHRFDPLAVTIDHAARAGELPPHHGDPFDRMLIAQAQLERLTIVTRDRRFAAYDVALLPA